MNTCPKSITAFASVPPARKHPKTMRESTGKSKRKIVSRRFAPPSKQFRSICESFVNYCNLLLQFTTLLFYANTQFHKVELQNSYCFVVYRILLKEFLFRGTIRREIMKKLIPILLSAIIVRTSAHGMRGDGQ